jgi:hypothetical protein
LALFEREEEKGLEMVMGGASGSGPHSKCETPSVSDLGGLEDNFVLHPIILLQKDRIELGIAGSTWVL